MERQEAIAALRAIVTGLFLRAMDGVLGVIAVKDDERGWAGVGGEKLLHQPACHAVELGTCDVVVEPRERRVGRQGGTGIRETIEEQLEERIVA